MAITWKALQLKEKKLPSPAFVRMVNLRQTHILGGLGDQPRTILKDGTTSLKAIKKIHIGSFCW